MSRLPLIILCIMVQGIVCAASSWEPAQTGMMTRWGKTVTPDNVWAEYPRPQLVRSDWQNLNGLWEYALLPKAAAAPSEYSKQILVPFCAESTLSGVREKVTPEDRIWYRRTFDIPQNWSDKRIILNFEAVDWQCAVWVNDAYVGSHQGGYDRFSFDITDYLNKQGLQKMVVSVWDPTNFGTQARGKQRMTQQGIWYTPVSGIWQTVWLEAVPVAAAIKEIKIIPDVDKQSVTVIPMLFDPKSEVYQVIVTVLEGQTPVVRQTGKADKAITLRIDNPKLWSPENPFLYDLQLELITPASKNGQPQRNLETLTSYFGMRKISLGDGPFGKILCLNDKPLFQYGTLDQGWWPDGLHTPPSDEAMKYDIEMTKQMGFNMIRKHIKVEPDRWYYWCDKLGILVWQDMPSGMVVLPQAENNRAAHPQQVFPEDPDIYRRTDNAAQFEYEMKRMIDLHYNAPSIVVWVPFNEGWGQYDTERIAAFVKKLDPSRLVNAVSGWALRPGGDIYDIHTYHEQVKVPQMQADRATVIGEYGGIGYPIKDHLWNPEMRNWGYQTYHSGEELYRHYVHKFNQIVEMKEKGLSAAVYTQTTDVEGEVNGLLTYDREIVKIDPEKLMKLHSVLYDDDRPDSPDKLTIAEGLKSHDRALHIKDGWIRDPYIILGPDGYYYLTGTTQMPDQSPIGEATYNTGLGESSLVGWQMQVWKSADLIEWESLGVPFTLKDGVWFRERPARFEQVDQTQWRLWAPELHWLGDRWALVHTSPSPVNGANFALSAGREIQGPWTHPMGVNLGRRHDPSLFQDDDGIWYMLWENTLIAPLSKDFTRFTADPVRIDPAGSRPGPDGSPISRIGHEGATLRKIGGKYVHFGTAWSTDRGRKGTYNLYYCTADNITGPYGPRQFVGRFLGHGTPFQDKAGRWWCTAFYNANVPPLNRDQLRTADMSDNAYTINPQGVTLVPLDVKLLEDGAVYIRAKDPDYAIPGKEEVQRFVF